MFNKHGNITYNTETSPILYSHPSIQDVISGGNPDPIPIVLNVEVEHKGHLQIFNIQQNQMVTFNPWNWMLELITFVNTLFLNPYS